MKKNLLLLILALSAGYSFSQQWVVVPSPNPGTTRNILRGIGFVTSNDGWAVGVYGEQPSNTLAMHFNGSSWSVISTPNPGSQYNELWAVRGFSSNDVYAVGWSAGVPAVPQMLALRWNGSSWSQMNTPTVSGGSGFQCMLTFAPNDIYAAGYKAVGAPGPTTGTLAAHWNGSSWEILTTPNQSNNRHNEITSMDGLSGNDIWAVGYSRNIGGNYQAMVLHKIGSSWNIVPVPQPGSENFLYSVDVISANDIWATGLQNSGSGYSPLFLHYNGSTWTVVSSPGGGAGTVANSANDIWSAATEFVHYDGNTWNSVTAAVPFGGNLGSIWRVSSTDIWTAGRFIDGSDLKTLIMHFGNFTGIQSEGIIPGSFRLEQNVPNPFNPVTKITFALPVNSFVNLVVYDILGRKIQTIARENFSPGTYTVEWNAANYPSGVYFYKLTTDNFSSTKSMMLIK